MILIMADHFFLAKLLICYKTGLFYTVLYIWYVAFIESYYFLWVKKTIEQLYQNMCLLTRKMIDIDSLSVQNIL